MARSFNGSSDFILATSPTFSAGALSVTIAGWFYPTATGNQEDVAVLGTVNDASVGTQLRMDISSGQAARTEARSSGGSLDNAIESTTSWTVNTWNHACSVFVINSSFVITTLIVYLNGAGKNSLTITQPQPGAISGFSIGDLHLAGQIDANFFTGNIADIAWWTTQLSDAEILALANGARPYTVRPLSLAGYWPLDGLQSPEPDLSTKANNGTLTGTAKAFGPPIMQFTPRWPMGAILPSPTPVIPLVPGGFALSEW